MKQDEENKEDDGKDKDEEDEIRVCGIKKQHGLPD